MDDLEFEDPYEDAQEDEEAVIREKLAAKAKSKSKANKSNSSEQKSTAAGDDDEVDEPIDDDEDEIIIDDNGDERLAGETAEDVEEEKKQLQKFVWRPGQDDMSAEEKLDYDSSAYTMLHKMRTDWPCLSFDILPDQLGHFRNKFPLSMYMVAGTQADARNKNKVMLLKCSDMHKTKHDDRDSEDDEEGSDSDPEDLDDDPTLEEKSFAHDGGVNRVRVCPQHPNLIATQAETSKVHIWNVAPYVSALDGASGNKLPKANAALHTFAGGAGEGWALAWSPKVAGRMVTGDGHKNIFLWEMKAGGAGWNVDKIPFKGHSATVEDLQWSPSEAEVFASASSDKTIGMWDIRVKEKRMAWVAAHKADVNVLSWNSKVHHLLASGGDDGTIKIWDLRNFKSYVNVEKSNKETHTHTHIHKICYYRVPIVCNLNVFS